LDTPIRGFFGVGDRKWYEIFQALHYFGMTGVGRLPSYLSCAGPGVMDGGDGLLRDGSGSGKIAGAFFIRYNGYRLDKQIRVE